MTQLKVLGAGLPRTATLTQKIALEMLGFGPCYHMVEMLTDMDLVKVWTDAFEGNYSWDEVLRASRLLSTGLVPFSTRS